MNNAKIAIQDKRRIRYVIESYFLLFTIFLLLFMGLGSAMAQQQAVPGDLTEDSAQPSNIESWSEEDDLLPTRFGMGFESRASDSNKPGPQSSDRMVNNW